MHCEMTIRWKNHQLQNDNEEKDEAYKVDPCSEIPTGRSHAAIVKDELREVKKFMTAETEKLHA